MSGRMMRTLLVLIGMALSAGPAVAREEILSFIADIKVGDDGVLEVTETIRVRAERGQIRRGIYRDFPTRLMRDDGLYQKTGFEVLEILKNGSPEPYHLEWQGFGTRVYIGSENVLIRPGDHTYSIRYRTTRQLRFFADHDELYWNVTGNFWSFPIVHSEARVRLPAGARIGELDAFTGRFGQSGRDFRVDSKSDDRFVIRTTRRLSPGEGLTILATFQKGLIAQPSEGQKLIWLISDNIGMLVLLLGGCGVFAFHVYCWNKVGRDPEKGTIIPLFEPPAGVSPAAASFLHFWGFRKAARKPLAFIAAVVSLAVKGLIRLRQEGKTLVLEPAGVIADDLFPAEAVIARQVHVRPDGLAINKANAKTVTSMRRAFRKAIKDDYDHRYMRNNTVYFIIGLMLSVISVVAFFFLQMPAPEHNGPLFVALIGSGFASVVFFLGFGWVSDLLPGGGPALLGVIYMLIGLAVWTIAGAVAVTQLPPILLVAALILASTALVNVVMFHLLRAPTIAGRELLDRIEGFKLYLSIAEADRMNLVSAPDVNEEIFEKYLPYAIALAVEEPWSNAFAAHVAKTTRDRSAATYHPGWYSGGRFDASSLSAATGSMVAAMSSSIASATPSRSGSGGGGFSGGGGGGGGGGGW